MYNRYNVYCIYSVCLVAQSCPTLCDPMDYSPPGSSIHGDSPDKNTGVGCHALLQGIYCINKKTHRQSPAPVHQIHRHFFTGYCLCPSFPGGSDGKASACNAGDLGSIPGSEDQLEKIMATHFSILAWKIPWMEEPGGL